MKVFNNLPNKGICICGYPLDENGYCSNPECDYTGRKQA